MHFPNSIDDKRGIAVANQLLIGNTGFTGRWAKRGVAAIFAGAAALLITACGGGGVSAPTVVGGALQVLPGTTDMFANTPVTFTISGGKRPYTAFSSNSSVLPLNISINEGATFTATALNPAIDTAVIITVRDAEGITATATANIKSNVLLSTIEISNSINAGNSCGGANVCSGSDAIASITARQAGSPLSNRAVRFEIVSGALSIVSAGQLVQAITISTDTSGIARVTVRAPVSVTSQYSILRASDSVTGQNTSYVLTLGQTIDPTAIQITPNNFQWSSPFKNECASGAVTNHLITGGTAPYTIRQSIPDFSVIVGSPLAASSVPVPPNGTTLGINGGTVIVNVTGFVCSAGSNGNVYTVTDAIGRVATFSIGNTPGTLDRPAPSAAIALPVPTITPNTFAGLGCGVSFSSFVSQTIPTGYTGTIPVLTATAVEANRIDAQLSAGILTVTRRPTDAGGGGTTIVRVFNGVNFSDVSITLTGTAPFSCAAGTVSTPITIIGGNTIVLASGLVPTTAGCKSVLLEGGVAPYTVTSLAPTLAGVSFNGLAPTTALTIAAGAPRAYFACPGTGAPTAGATFISVTDSSVPVQTLIQFVTVTNP